MLQSIGFWHFTLLLVLFCIVFITGGALLKGVDPWRSISLGIPFGIVSGFVMALYGWFTWLHPRK